MKKWVNNGIFGTTEICKKTRGVWTKMKIILPVLKIKINSEF